VDPNDDEVETLAEEGVTPTESDEVGYRCPPQSSRFKKGQSGNPKGRPKGSLNMANIFTKTLREKVVINENGQRRTVTKLQAALKQLVNKAASGDLRALRQLVELSRDSEAKENQPGAMPSAINELDREVMNDIVRRFQMQESEDGGEGQDQLSTEENVQ
jgi:hypothetical protein